MLNNFAEISTFERIQSDQHDRVGIHALSVFGAYDKDVTINAKESADDNVVADYRFARCYKAIG
jgi:hypothetical protein